MNTKTFWQLASVGIVAVVAAVVLLLPGGADKSAQPPALEQESVPAVAVRLTIENLYAGEQISVPAGTTVLEMLRKVDAEDPRVRLGTKEYASLGVLVESINGMTNGTGGEYWQYRVNGVMPQVGADQLAVTNNDAVEWYFEASEF